MVYVKDEGSEFEAPIDFVWKYILGAGSHDASHKTTRKPRFEKFSDITFVYGSERLLGGQWAPDSLRISIFPPVCVVTEWLDGVLSGSKFAYVYSPNGERTRIDVYGEFTSKTLPPDQVEARAREFLDTEYRDDAPVIKAEYAKARSSRQ